MKLYELAQSYQDILDLAENTDDNEHLLEALTTIEDSFEVKLENIGKVIQTLDADTIMIDNEVKRLQNKKRAIQTNKKNLKTYVENEMNNIGKTKVKTALFNFGIQANPPRLVVVDEKEIPKSYWIEQAPKLDRRQLLEDLKSDTSTQFEGARIEQGRSLRIR